MTDQNFDNRLIDIDDPLDCELIEEFAGEDQRLEQADAAMKRARMQFEMAAAKYAAIRDVVRKRIPVNPYWGPVTSRGTRLPFPTGGRFRFINMTIGAAAILALQLAREPITLEDLSTTLRAGGLHRSASFDLRTLYATLTNHKSVAKTGDDPPKYHLKTEDDDSPF